MRGPFAGFLAGLLGLTLLEAFLSGPQATNAGGLLQAVAGGVHRYTDPTVPAIPDLRGSSSSGPNGPGGSAAPGSIPLPPMDLGNPNMASAQLPSRLPSTLTA